MIRALHVINSLATGGAETQLLQLCENLAKSGVEPVVATLLPGGELRQAYGDAGIELIDLSRNDKLSSASIIQLLQEIRIRQIDIVHTHLVHAGVVGKLTAWIARVPVVTTRHYTRDAKWRQWDFRAEDILTRLLADRVIAIGEQVRATLVERNICRASKIVIHRNAIDTASYTTTRREKRELEFIIGTVGRLHVAKAHEVFLDAFALVHATHPMTRGIIVGGGERRDELADYAKKLGIENVITFTGPVEPEDVRNWLQRFNVFVLSSDWEGLPVALIEAAAAGLPLVTTNVGGCPEVVHDGENGFLVPPREPNAMANAIMRLIGDTSLRETFGAKAQEIAQTEFDIQRLAHQTADLYRRNIGTKESYVIGYHNEISLSRHTITREPI